MRTTDEYIKQLNASARQQKILDGIPGLNEEDEANGIFLDRCIQLQIAQSLNEIVEQLKISNERKEEYS